MRNLIKIVCTISFLAFSFQLTAAEHPEAHFGEYGIQHLNGLSAYQQYVGETVRYLAAGQGINGAAYDDEKGFLSKGGKFDTDYIIKSITGNDKQMTFTLLEKGGKNKVKMVVNNQNEYYTYGKYTYCITDKYTIPLFLIDRFNADKQKYLGKVYPEAKDSPVSVVISDVSIKKAEKYGEYPTICFVLKDNNTGKTFEYDPKRIDDLNDLGIVYNNPLFKCSYTVVNVEYKKSDYYPYNEEKHYTVVNSIDGSSKEVSARSAETSAFSGDNSGRFTATLSNVEKPANSEVRYGERTVVSDKDITKFSYVDNFIDILIFATSTQFSFLLKNVSDNTIKVVWNEAVFVDVDGSTSKVMHAGTKYSQREGDQPASTIIKGAKIDDIAAPTNKVYYSEILKEWSSRSLYSNATKGVDGETIRLMLPIQVKDVINEYIFEFVLDWEYDHPEYLNL